jgi:hypothetical protein
MVEECTVSVMVEAAVMVMVEDSVRVVVISLPGIVETIVEAGTVVT